MRNGEARTGAGGRTRTYEMWNETKGEKSVEERRGEERAKEGRDVLS